jgi:hypothetical protein
MLTNRQPIRREHSRSEIHDDRLQEEQLTCASFSPVLVIVLVPLHSGFVQPRQQNARKTIVKTE